MLTSNKIFSEKISELQKERDTLLSRLNIKYMDEKGDIGKITKEKGRIEIESIAKGEQV